MPFFVSRGGLTGFKYLAGSSLKSPEYGVPSRSPVVVPATPSSDGGAVRTRAVRGMGRLVWRWFRRRRRGVGIGLRGGRIGATTHREDRYQGNRETKSRTVRHTRFLSRMNRFRRNTTMLR